MDLAKTTKQKIKTLQFPSVVSEMTTNLLNKDKVKASVKTEDKMQDCWI